MTYPTPLHFSRAPQVAQTRRATPLISLRSFSSMPKMAMLPVTSTKENFSRFRHFFMAFEEDLSPPASNDMAAHNNCLCGMAFPLVALLKQASPQISFAFKMVGRDVTRAMRVFKAHDVALGVGAAA